MSTESEQTQSPANHESAPAGEAVDVNADAPAKSARPHDARQRRWKLISIAYRAGLALLALAIGLGVFRTLASLRQSPEQRDRGEGALVVETVQASAQLLDRPWLGYGTARAMDAADIAPEVTGRVIARDANIEPGVWVEAGTVLLQLDPHDFEQRAQAARERVAQLEADVAGLDREEARLAEQVELAREEAAIAQRDYDRTLAADAEGVGSPGGNDARLRSKLVADRALSALLSQQDQIPTRRASLNARLQSERTARQIAERDLERTVITAPVSGVLQSVTPEVGEWITAGQAVARVVDLSRIEVPLRVPVSAAGTIEPGDEAHLASEGSDRRSWTGGVRRLAPEADEQSRTMTLYVEIEQPESGEGLLRPGQFVMGRVFAGDEQPRLLVPRRAIRDDRVFVASGTDQGEGLARVEPRAIRVLYSVRMQFPGLSPDDTEWAAVELGGALQPDDTIIASNLDQLRPGMLVDPRDVVESGAVQPTVELGGNLEPAADGGDR